MKGRRVLLIGLDAADREILLDGCDDGRFPNFRRMRDLGTWGAVDMVPGFGSGASWPSFYTGVSPARHGRYFYRQVKPGEYEATRFEDKDFHGRPIWEVLSDAGRRVAVFDVPKAGLSPGLNGLHVVDWLVHGPVYHNVCTSPAAVAAELTGAYGADSMPRCDHPGKRSSEELKTLRDVCLARVRSKEAATLAYLDNEPWDLFLTVIADPHCIGHQCWHVRDPNHPDHDASAADLVGDPVLAVYEEIDASLGRILDHVDDDVSVIVTSVTGMGPNYTGNYVLDEVLRRLEGQEKTRSLDWLVRAKLLAKRILPNETRKRLRRSSRKIEERVAHSDRERRRFFTVPHNDFAGAIRVNLVGREPLGLVPAEDVESIFHALRKDLLEVRNLDTGRPVVDDVVRIANLCDGDKIDDMPDFFVLWNREARIERVGSPKIGEVVYRQRGNRTGDHNSDSVFFAMGPGFTPGEVESVSMMDFAPTLAVLAGIPVPPTDGRPIPALCPSVRDDALGGGR